MSSTKTEARRLISPDDIGRREPIPRFELPAPSPA